MNPALCCFEVVAELHPLHVMPNAVSRSFLLSGVRPSGRRQKRSRAPTDFFDSSQQCRSLNNIAGFPCLRSSRIQWECGLCRSDATLDSGSFIERTRSRGRTPGRPDTDLTGVRAGSVFRAPSRSAFHHSHLQRSASCSSVVDMIPSA